jgi:ABC-type antimicrobial peptide transport system permease subunit
MSGIRGTAHQIITNKKLTRSERKELESFGVVRNSKFHKKTIDSSTETMKTIKEIIGYTGIGIIAIASIPATLVVLILFISIILRTKEIGILKAIGAKEVDIVSIFTLESLLISSSAGLVSLILSLPSTLIVEKFIESKYHLSHYVGSSPLELNPIAIVIATCTMVVLITLLGLLPGVKASRLDPKKLLRSIG